MYKAVSPSYTIKRIETILNKIGIQTHNVFYGQEGICRSVRVTIKGNNIELLDIGTNGKGMNTEYALASAYGELMERLQNKMLLFATKYATKQFKSSIKEKEGYPQTTLGFRYFPDEEFRSITDQELCQLARTLLPSSNLFLKHKNGVFYDMPFIPFYEATNNTITSLPYDLIRFAAGTTGLCAGNIPEEAILQGINEIYERYVLQQIYLFHPILPTINPDFFEGTEIIKKINVLRSIHKDWKFIIKDCSISKELPVIGLLIINHTKSKYTFRLGADLYPHIALQRCLTEIFQGTNIDESTFLSIDLTESWNPKEEYKKNLTNGQGHFPVSIFKETNTSATPFHIKPDFQNSFRSNLHKITTRLKSSGYKLYIRDNSFLGFPTYHVYIPGLSEVHSELYNIKKDLVEKRRYYKIQPEFRLKNLNKTEIYEITRKYQHEETHYIRLSNYSWSVYNYFNRHLLIALLAYKTNKYHIAYVNMRAFLIEKEMENKTLEPYYYCIRDYFILKHKKQKDIQQILTTIYTPEIAALVINDMKNPDKVLDEFILPTCFKCAQCHLTNSCAYKHILSLEEKIQQIQIHNIIKQSNLSEIFYSNNKKDFCN